MTGSNGSKTAAVKPVKKALKNVVRSFKAGSYKVRSGLLGSPEGTYRLFSAGGGHGSSFLISSLQKTGRNIAIRPDNALSNEEGWIDKSLDDRPEEVAVEKFRELAGYTLDTSISINDNFLAYLEHLERVDGYVLLSRISRVGPFLTRNGIKQAICLVRHPLHAYVSYVDHQHPEAAANLGDMESLPRIEWYCLQWNSMTKDYLDSGSKIVRYEFLPDDVKGIESPPLSKLVGAKWRTGTRNHGVLSAQGEEYLRGLVSETYERVYDRWDI